MRRPGHDLRHRERHLHAPEQLAVGEAHAASGVLRLVGHVVEAGEDVAEDDQQHVGHERDGRREEAAPRERQQQEERRDARDRVEHAGDLRDRVDQPATPVGDHRERERDREADRHRHHREQHVLEERIDVAVEVVGDPARAEAVVGHAGVLGALADLDLGEQRAHSASAPLGTASGSALRAWPRSSIESTPVTAPCSSTTGPYWASSASRSESASRSTSSISSTGSARERSSSPTRSPCKARSESHPSGRPSSSTSSG